MILSYLLIHSPKAYRLGLGQAEVRDSTWDSYVGSKDCSTCVSICCFPGESIRKWDWKLKQNSIPSTQIRNMGIPRGGLTSRTTMSIPDRIFSGEEDFVLGQEES